MRNYIKLAFVRLYPLPYDPLSFYVVCGPAAEQIVLTEDELAEADEDDLADLRRGNVSEGMQFWINYWMGVLRESTPGLQFEVTEPLNIYFLLDQENLAQIINCANGNIWSQTRLNNEFGPIPDLPLLYDVTQLEDEEGSPRKSWSHGH